MTISLAPSCTVASAIYGPQVAQASTLPAARAAFASAGAMNTKRTSLGFIPARSSAASTRKCPVCPRRVAIERPFNAATVWIGESCGTTSDVTAPSDCVTDTARIGMAEAMPETSGASPMPPASIASAFKASISIGAPANWLHSRR